MDYNNHIDSDLGEFALVASPYKDKDSDSEDFIAIAYSGFREKIELAHVYLNEKVDKTKEQIFTANLIEDWEFKLDAKGLIDQFIISICSKSSPDEVMKKTIEIYESIFQKYEPMLNRRGIEIPDGYIIST